MLNQNDRRRLEEIERRLQEEDPEFARRFTRLKPQASGRSRLLPTLVLVVGVLGLLLSMLVALPAVFLLSVVATVGGGFWLHRRRR
jgi:Flp pilus assembly protein TadB